MKWMKTGLLVIACSASLAVAGQVQAAETLTAQEMSTVIGGGKTSVQCTEKHDGCIAYQGDTTGGITGGECTQKTPKPYNTCKTASGTGTNPVPSCNIDDTDCDIKVWARPEGKSCLAAVPTDASTVAGTAVTRCN